MSAQAVIARLRAQNYTLVTAESCTGGGLGAALTSVSGASAVYQGGFVTYSNAAKKNCLGVLEEELQEHGAVSAVVAQAMAKGARAAFHADISVAITGIAGPKSDDTQKPVGLVYIAVETAAYKRVKQFNFGDIGREKVRQNAIFAALQCILEIDVAAP